MVGGSRASTAYSDQGARRFLDMLSGLPPLPLSSGRLTAAQQAPARALHHRDELFGVRAASQATGMRTDSRRLQREDCHPLSVPRVPAVTAPCQDLGSQPQWAARPNVHAAAECRARWPCPSGPHGCYSVAGHSDLRGVHVEHALAAALGHLLRGGHPLQRVEEAVGDGG